MDTIYIFLSLNERKSYLFFDYLSRKNEFR